MAVLREAGGADARMHAAHRGAGRAGATGYAHEGYAASLAEFGTPRHLPASGGSILERPLPGLAGRDAMGPYPLFSCRDWSGLSSDLEALAADGLVSLALVADPFGDFERTDLERWFPDRLVAFKDHFVTDLSGQGEIGSRHHRYYARRALKTVDVEIVEAPDEAFLDEWTALYGVLAERHGLAGMKAFSRAAFARQLTLPGAVVLRASEGGETIGAQIWYVQGDAAFSHLTAVSGRGYELRAAYAIYARAIEHFRGRLRWLDLGAGAGVAAGAGDGLSDFKSGWATETRPAYFCGRIFDRARYEAATAARGAAGSIYFPAYRSGEFG